jgi:murein tripeptide amidase MpaA
MININSNFDSGNIEVVSIKENGEIDLKIRKDISMDFFQWFHFRLTGAANTPVKMRILNAGESAFPEGWENYQSCASYDRMEWFRIATTSYENGVLTIEYTPDSDSMYFAYFAPYSWEQHQDLIHTAVQSEYCALEVIGESVEGRTLDLLKVSTGGEGKKKVWLIARQHPGESMAEWFMEGFIYRLLDDTDPVSRKLLEKADFYMIPNMNPDGSVNGNLRANVGGANLNREWQAPSEHRSPEVYWTLKKMDEIGVDINLDVHGDESIPYNFVAGSEGNPSYTDRIAALEKQFIADWIKVTPDFQDEHGYDKDEPGQANMTVCTNAISDRFDCLALTIEMPFKDHDDMPDEVYGWSDERSVKLGESVMEPILWIVDDLRA